GETAQRTRAPSPPASRSEVPPRSQAAAGLLGTTRDLFSRRLRPAAPVENAPESKSQDRKKGTTSTASETAPEAKAKMAPPETGKAASPPESTTPPRAGKKNSARRGGPGRPGPGKSGRHHGNGARNGASNGSSSAAALSTKGTPPLHIIDSRAKEPSRFFDDGAGASDAAGQPPIGIAALAACTSGSIHQSPDTLPAGGRQAILVALNGSLEKDRRLIEETAARAGESPLLACWKTGRLDKLASKLESGTAFQQFTNMLTAVQGIISTDPRTSSLLKELHVARRHLNVPLPYPIDAPSWDRSMPADERERAIFISADGFNPQLAAHRSRIELINQLATKHRLKLTLYHNLPGTLTEIKVPEGLLEEPSETLEYPEFLTLLSRHRFVTGFGKNPAGGELWGDALLSRNIYFGGSSKAETVLFPDTCGSDALVDSISRTLSRLAVDNKAYSEATEHSRRLALKTVSFKAVNRRLGAFLESASRQPVLVPR
ncbi:MAG: hypothetical protein ACC661_05665, partial [Verrucomicrobiales bacterium]